MIHHNGGDLVRVHLHTGYVMGVEAVDNGGELIGRAASYPLTNQIHRCAAN
jgi:hypothetical protein